MFRNARYKEFEEAELDEYAPIRKDAGFVCKNGSLRVTTGKESEWIRAEDGDWIDLNEL